MQQGFAVIPSSTKREHLIANLQALNLGNALGAIAGASVLNIGLSYTAVSFAGAGLSVLALRLVWLQMKLAANKAVDYQPCA